VSDIIENLPETDKYTQTTNGTISDNVSYSIWLQRLPLKVHSDTNIKRQTAINQRDGQCSRIKNIFNACI
ncbi:hypothetical protein ALC53_05757, partial [Atta colombica]